MWKLPIGAPYYRERRRAGGSFGAAIARLQWGQWGNGANFYAAPPIIFSISKSHVKERVGQLTRFLICQTVTTRHHMRCLSAADTQITANVVYHIFLPYFKSVWWYGSILSLCGTTSPGDITGQAAPPYDELSSLLSSDSIPGG